MDFDHRGASKSIKLAVAYILLAGLALMPARLRAQDDSFSAPPAPDDDILEPADPGWNNVNEFTAGSEGQVLEIPQAVAPENEAELSNSDTSMPTDDPDATVAEAAAAAQDPANDPADDPAHDPANDLAAYESRQASIQEYVSPGLPRPLVAYPQLAPAFGSGWHMVTIAPPKVIVIRPGTLSTIPSTSPLLTTPRGAGPVFGGWWNRAR